MIKHVLRFSNAVELLEHSFKAYKKKPAYTCMGRTLTYGELDKLSYRFACFLQQKLGFKPGDRIAIQLPNILQYPIVFYGAVRAGVIVVNTNPLYTPREIRHQLRDSGARAIVVLSNIAHNAANIVKQTDVENVIVTDIADVHSFPKRQLINYVVKHVKKMVPDFNFDNQIPFRAGLKKCKKPLVKPDISPDTTMFFQYTGGTTGVSKGAMLTHHNMMSNVWQLISHMPTAFDEGSETFVCCLPLYHIYALNLHGLSAACCGEHNVLIPNPRDLDAFVKLLKPHQMTIFVGINTLYNALCRHKGFREDVDFSKLKIACAGGMALTNDAAAAWKELTGLDIIEGYGLTETSPVVCGNYAHDIRQGTIGPALPETEIKVVDDDGVTLPTGQAGELCVRGPQVMKGYWNKPEETAEVFDAEGWFKTGDIAVIEEDGYARIVDRKKDMIIVSGFNVYPNEIEEVIAQMDSVLEVAVIGVPDANTGEAVKLFVVPATDDLTEDDIYDHCCEKLTRYKIPKIIEFRDSLPKTNVGKILRRELRES